MVNAQQWLNKGYPKDGVCCGEFDQKNSNRRRGEITELDISNKNLEGILRLEGFEILKKIDCSGNGIRNFTRKRNRN